MLVITPMVGMPLNITRWFQPVQLIGCGIVDRLEPDRTSSGDLHRLLFGIDLMFGGLDDSSPAAIPGGIMAWSEIGWQA